jgi:uncharacterized protein (TIGR03066 family)
VSDLLPVDTGRRCSLRAAAPGRFHKENPMKKAICLAALACAVLLLSSSTARAQTPKELIVGKWLSLDEKQKGTLEFTADGKLKVSIEGLTIDGTYKIVGEDGLEITIGKETNSGKFKVSKETLELIKDGKTDKFKRIK